MSGRPTRSERRGTAFRRVANCGPPTRRVDGPQRAEARPVTG
ncbi:hypothetical protein ACN27J_05735 [Solwaraspora sp. WMMB762]